MSELFPELVRDVCYYLLRNNIKIDGDDGDFVAATATLQELGIVVTAEIEYVKCAYEGDDDFTSRPDMDCSGRIELVSPDMVCPECGYPVYNHEKKTNFTKIVINLNQDGIENYLERIISSREFVDTCLRQNDAELHVEFSDGKKLTIAWPDYATPRLQAGLFFAEPTLYIINSPIDKPSTTVIEDAQYLFLGDVLTEDCNVFEEKLQLAAVPIEERVELAEIETKFDDMLGKRENPQRWQFFEQDFIPALVQYITENPALVQEYLERLRRFSDTIFGEYYVPMGGAGRTDLRPINKYEVMNQVFAGNLINDAKCYVDSELTYNDVVGVSYHFTVDPTRPDKALISVAGDRIVSTAWNATMELRERFGSWKVIIIPKYLLLELISELRATDLLEM